MNYAEALAEAKRCHGLLQKSMAVVYRPALNEYGAILLCSAWKTILGVSDTRVPIVAIIETNGEVHERQFDTKRLIEGVPVDSVEGA